MESLSPLFNNQYHFVILIVFIANYLLAGILCFTFVCFYLLDFNTKKKINPKFAISTAIIIHLAVTLTVLWLFTKLNVIESDFKTKILYQYPALKAIIKSNDIIIGYSIENNSILSGLICILFTVTIILVLIFYFLLMRKIWTNIKKATQKMTNYHRRMVALMLTSRTFVPLFLGYIPLTIISFGLYFDLFLNYLFIYLFLFTITITHGLFNSLATILIFKPYRHGFVNLIKDYVPIPNKIGFITLINVSTIDKQSKIFYLKHF